MTTIYDTPIFRMSLKSLVDSTNENQTILLLEDGLHPQDACRAYAERFSRVHYNKYGGHIRITDMVDQAISRLDLSVYEYLIIVHNDVFFPVSWLTWLDQATRRLKDTDNILKCPLLNLSYGEYAIGNMQIPEDLKWEQLLAKVTPHQIYRTTLDEGATFGLGQDRWNMARTGRTSPAFAINMQYIINRGGFRLNDLEYDLSLMCQASKNKQWNIWIDNPPLIHFRPTESGNDTVLKFTMGQGHTHYDFMKETERNFLDHYGFDIEEWFDKEFGNIKYWNKEKIEAVFNSEAMNLSELDFVFDEIWNDN